MPCFPILGSSSSTNTLISNRNQGQRASSCIPISTRGDIVTSPDGPEINCLRMLSPLVAGVGAGALSSVVCAPLDLIRTRMQVIGSVPSMNNAPRFSIYRALRDVVAADGIQGCFRGLGATLVVIPSFWGMYFPVYEMTKRYLHILYKQDQMNEAHLDRTIHIRWEDYNSRVPPQVHLVSAILAGAGADLVCNPLFVVRTRMQTEALHYLERSVEDQRPLGMAKTVKHLYREGGVKIFWAGFSASLWGLSHVAIQFPVYEWMKAEAKSRSMTNEDCTSDLLLASAISKICATLITYPHEVLRSRMMDCRPTVDRNTCCTYPIKENSGLVSTFRRVVTNEGWRALYAGLQVSLVRVVPNCCITFISYELILRWCRQN